MRNDQLTHEGDYNFFWLKVAGVLLSLAAALTFALDATTAAANCQSERERKTSASGSKREVKPYLRIYTNGVDTIDLGYSLEQKEEQQDQKNKGGAETALLFTHKGTMRSFMSGAKATFILDGTKSMEVGEASLIDYYFLGMTQVETVKLVLMPQELERIKAAKRVSLRLEEIEMDFGEETQAILKNLYTAGVK